LSQLRVDLMLLAVTHGNISIKVDPHLTEMEMELKYLITQNSLMKTIWSPSSDD